MSDTYKVSKATLKNLQETLKAASVAAFKLYTAAHKELDGASITIAVGDELDVLIDDIESLTSDALHTINHIDAERP